jgi:predicted acylesterase/phospholipase RssA
MQPQAERPLLEQITSLSLAGGGNRCWWQAGVLDVWLQSGRLDVRQLVGTSAGAALAAAVLCGRLEHAFDECRKVFADNPSMWRGHKDAWFASEYIYPRWVESFMNEYAFKNLQASGVEFMVGVARLPTALPKTIGLGLAVLAYLCEKYGAYRLHPKLPGHLGLRLELHHLQREADAATAAHLLVSAAAAPPLLSARLVGDKWAVDGGFADNAPRLPLTKFNDRHMILLTRHYLKRPFMFQHEGRIYLQPSRPVPISTFGCTPRTDIRPAFELGRRDGMLAAFGRC